MDIAAQRRRRFKTPPVDSRQTQEARRAKALEEQKRKRAQQVDAFRQIEQFSDLNLEDSDNEVDEDDVPSSQGTNPMGGLAQLAAMLHPGDADPPPDSRSPTPSMERDDQLRTKKKRKGKGKKKANKWANKCMYAELLEMREDALWTEAFDIGGAPQRHGLPDDLQSSWVGLAPVPVGKRCLAVTMQSAGVSGIVPNTTLRSRLLGKVIIRPFPSTLPSNTILDCILDEKWRSNGILHILDVIRWKSQDIADCEAGFRFWWRDTRLAELPVWPLPAPHRPRSKDETSSPHESPPRYNFPYPTTFVPVPYTAPLTFETILGDLLDRARRGTVARLNIPVLSDTSVSEFDSVAEGEMEVDTPSGLWSADEIREVEFPITSDGLLLYVGEAVYESGESPLSVWIPRTWQDRDDHEQTKVEGGRITKTEQTPVESPLDTFERLVRRRLIAERGGISRLANLSVADEKNNIVEVEMDG